MIPLGIRQDELLYKIAERVKSMSQLLHMKKPI